MVKVDNVESYAKSDMVETIYGLLNGEFTKKDIGTFLSAYYEGLKIVLGDVNTYAIPGVCQFYFQYRPEREAREMPDYMNRNGGEPIQIPYKPAYNRLCCKVSKSLQQTVREATAGRAMR